MTNKEVIEIINDTECIVDNKVLVKSIKKYCEENNINIDLKYKICLEKSGYYRIAIKRVWLRIHRLIGEYIHGDLKSKHIHHIDNNKKNNHTNNLVAITNSEHILITKPQQYISESHSKSFGKRMLKYIKRTDVDRASVLKLRKEGLTIPVIAKRLSCSENTIRRRIDWSE